MPLGARAVAPSGFPDREYIIPQKMRCSQVDSTGEPVESFCAKGLKNLLVYVILDK